MSLEHNAPAAYMPFDDFFPAYYPFNPCFFYPSLQVRHETPRLEDFLGGMGCCPAQFYEAQGSSSTVNEELNSEFPLQYLLCNDVNVNGKSVLPEEESSSAVAQKPGVFEAEKCGGLDASVGVPCRENSSGVEKRVVAPPGRTSSFRGVTRHRWTGRYEAHLWDNTCVREGQKRRGRQVYLGGYDKEVKAARAYDLASLKYWGSSATTNFPPSTYSKEIEEMKNMTKQEFIASIRRKSSGFSRGASMYRGVTRCKSNTKHHQHGRWQARIGRVAGNKDLYLGTFSSEEEAAEAYDVAAIKFRGASAVTNFERNRYNLEAIARSDLPIGNLAKRLKLSSGDESQRPHDVNCIAVRPQHPDLALSNLFFSINGTCKSSDPNLSLCARSLNWLPETDQHNFHMNGNQPSNGGDMLKLTK